MTERIRRLREQSLAAPYQISAERALLVTEFYRSERAQNVSVPVRRALALEHILAHKHICINDGELIVGERGPAPKATPMAARPRSWLLLRDKTSKLGGRL